MAFERDGYFYDQQLKRYVLQFMAIFTGLQVQIGKWNDKDERLISVPIHYATPDRVVAAIMTDNTQNKPLRLPVLSAYMGGIELAPELMHGTGVERRNSYVPVGGLVPDDIKVIRQRMPVPYKISLDLNIYASNTDQHFQILEQILTLFEPQMTLQISDGIFDMQRLTSVQLTRVNVDSNYPIGQDRRIVQSTLSFTMPIALSIPANVRTDFVKKILMRVAAVDSISTDSFEIIGDIDGQEIPYETIVDGSSLTIDQN
jgi:T4-like virus Myoviridae tail sheath stabiliser